MALVVVAKSYYILLKVLVWWPLLWYNVQRFNHTMQKYKQMNEQNTFRNLFFNGAIYGWMYHLWMNLSFMDECVNYGFYGWMCHLLMNVPFIDECAIYWWMCHLCIGWMCHLWMNVPFMDEYAIYGWMCYLWMDVLPFDP